MLTKGDIVTKALKEIRISGKTSKPTADEVIDSIQTLDLMIGDWRNDAISITYANSPSYREVSASQVSGVEARSANAVMLNLALRLCSQYDVQPTLSLIIQANNAYKNLFNIILPTREGNPYVPVGGGSNYYSYFYSCNDFFTLNESAPVDPDTQILAVGDTYDYTINWDDWLSDGGAVMSYTIIASAGLTLIEHQLQGNEVYFKIAANKSGVQTVSIEIKSSLQGREDNRVINFNVLTSKTA